MAEYMEKLTRKNAEKLRIYGGIKRQEEIEKVLANDGNDGIPLEDSNAYFVLLSSVPFDDKIKFSDRIRKLPAHVLGELVELIKKVSPKSIKELNAKKLQLRLNELDRESFKTLSEFLDKQKVASKEDTQEPPRKKPKLE
eukprot:TRINITY_DN1644_c0_g4_i3.p1 TRINITY_DN1644_c0_g4~~TRINITY_DN1644_c0_g4_i3.p1  ORF type:complete len:140 (-),score=46.11 TRINITY_DN1644_c0_g4_i3:127-546(-)